MVYAKQNVLAFLDDRKFRTRRIIKQQPKWIEESQWWIIEFPKGKFQHLDFCRRDIEDIKKLLIEHYAKYQVGDDCYVAEGYKIFDIKARRASGMYLADKSPIDKNLLKAEWKKWRKREYPHRPTPGRFMYKSLARITYPLTGIGVERVKDISPEDAILEGILVRNTGTETYPQFEYCGFDDFWTKKPVEAFHREWVCIHGQEFLERNDWVFVYKWDEIKIGE